MKFKKTPVILIIVFLIQRIIFSRKNKKIKANVINKIKKINNSEQVILVTTKKYNTNHGQLRLFEKKDKWKQILSTQIYIGKNGFTDIKVEGDQKTPTGKYTISHGFGYRENPGTKLDFKNASSNDVWVDDPSSKFYNTWQQKNNHNKDWNSAEEMTHVLYKYGIIINYNTEQIPGRGSAIFIHTAAGYTNGCIGTKESDLIKIMKWINPDKNPLIIQTPQDKINNY